MNVKALGRRTVLADFDGGQLTSDAGVVLLEQVDRRINLLDRFARCFRDYRDEGLIEHPVADTVRQRIFGLALGYEDLNDHDDLSRDPMLATAVGKAGPTGQSRRRKRDKGRALAGKSTLNRVELTPEHVSPDARYHKVALDFDATERLFVDIFLESFTQPPAEIVLDLDTTDDPLYGQQLCLFADRTSTATIRGNQIRLWFSSMAYVLVSALRRLGLAGTQLANARCDTIRLKLLKIGAAIKVTVRHVWISMSSSYPLQELFRQVLGRLQPVPLRC
jgi:hypothetical protein